MSQGADSEARDPAAPRRGALAAWRLEAQSLLLLAAVYTFGPVFRNETDRLAAARQVVDPAWLPQDWFLGQSPGYRGWFQMTIGQVTHLPFGPAAFAGRLVTFAAFAVAFAALARALRMRPVTAWIALAAFLAVQSLGAGEWMVGAFETKPLAYACLLGAVASLANLRLLTGALLAGLALSFHVIIGAFGTAALGLVALGLLARGELQVRRLPAALGVWALGAGFGLVAVGDFVLGGGGSAADSARAAEIYVHFRNPHHLDPLSFAHPIRVAAEVLLAAGVCAWAALRSPLRARRVLGGFGLATVIPYLIGLALALAGATAWLRFYWFRVPDTVLPLSFTLLVALVLQDQLAARVDEQRLRQVGRAISALLAVGLAATFIVAGGARAAQERPAFEADVAERDPALADALAWVREHAPQDAVFVLDPAFDAFYVVAERGVLACWKHMPATTPTILEWYERITANGGGIEPAVGGKAALAQLRQGFRAITADQVADLGTRFGVTHGLFEVAHDPFAGSPGVEPLFRNEGYVVHALGGASPTR